MEDIGEEKPQSPEAINRRRANPEGFRGMNFDLGRYEELYSRWVMMGIPWWEKIMVMK